MAQKGPVRRFLKDWPICKDILTKLEETGQIYIVDHDIPLSISKTLFWMLDTGEEKRLPS